MIPIRWSSSGPIPNARELLRQVELNGGCVVEYQRVWSAILIAGSIPEFVWIAPGRSRWLTGLGISISSMIIGWWSLPGLIWTPAAILYNLRGGTDVTRLIQITTPRNPPPLPGGLPPPLPSTSDALRQPPPLPADPAPGFVDDDEAILLRIVKERRRFGRYKLLSGLGLCVLIYFGMYGLSKVGSHSGTGNSVNKAPAVTRDHRPSSPDPEDADEAKEVQSSLEAAKAGDAKAQLNVGLLYYHGWGLAKDPEEGVKWLRKAAEQGNAEAQYSLGRAYADGVGVTADNSSAYLWYSIATEHGHQMATRMLPVVEQRLTPDQVAEAKKAAREMAEQIAQRP